MKEADIVFSRGAYWVYRHAKGYYEVFKNGVTHSTRCAIIGYSGADGLARAKREIERREAEDARK